MQIPTRWLVLLILVLAATLRAQPSLENARRAQLRLGPDVWSQIIRIENTARGSRYAPTVYALVFEFQRILWFYTDADGTQSLSLHYDDAEAEKANLGPLLHEIEPGFARWRGVSAAEVGHLAAVAGLRNGCFIESLALWRERIALGETTDDARLLSIYFDPATGRDGHTVLAFRERGTLKLIDPNRPRAVISVSARNGSDPLELAREYGGRGVWKARFLPLEAARAPAAATAIG